MIGNIALKVDKYNETYNFSLPSAYGRSIFTVPWEELGGRVEIDCPQTKYRTEVHFVTKPTFGNSLHRISSRVFDPQNKMICRITGTWDKELEFAYTNGKKEVINVNDLIKIPKRVRPLSKQEGNESRNLWRNVSRYLEENDVQKATEYKSEIEEKQRSEEKTRAEKGDEYNPRFFSKKGDGYVFKK